MELAFILKEFLNGSEMFCKPQKIALEDIAKPIEIVCNYELDRDNLLKKAFNSKIVNFVDTMINNFSKDDLALFYNNINDVIVKQKRMFFVYGSYYPYRNRIVIGHYENVIYHELFHMSSSLYTKDVSYSGFYQHNAKVILGKGLMEAYTDLLAKRYFCDEYDLYIHSKETVLLCALEKIVSKEKMESLYLRADLYGLIEELGKYNSFENIIDFINNFDSLHKSETEKVSSNNILWNIYSFLLDSFANKEKMIMGTDEYSEDFVDFISLFSKYLDDELLVKKYCKVKKYVF